MTATRLFFHCIVGLAWLPFVLPLAALGGGLDHLKADIEAAGVTLVVVPVTTDTERNVMTIPSGFPHRAVVVRYLSNDSFRREFYAANALTVGQEGPAGKVSFVLLNMAREPEWGPYREGLLAHEFGHVWLSANGFRSSPFQEGPEACVGIHAADILHHILIRQEMRRREIDDQAFWHSLFDGVRRQLEQSAADSPVSPCEKLILLSQWMDLRFGYGDSAEPFVEPLTGLFQDRQPDVVERGNMIETFLAGRDFRSISGFIQSFAGVHSLVDSYFKQLGSASGAK